MPADLRKMVQAELARRGWPLGAALRHAEILPNNRGNFYRWLRGDGDMGGDKLAPLLSILGLLR